jgi:uncharacterized protein YgbK (DUF1537 family)
MIPERILSYYGDDFSGATDVMEVLAWAGLPTVLFLQPPTDEQLARFPDARAMGVAGDSRSRPPKWMSDHLPTIFERLRSLGAPLCQYKLCSTFDSSPEIGSIGRAIEIGLDVVGGDWASIVVGAPTLRRYQAFGNLFARIDAATYRLDRHPTMTRHPVTPMDEADLRRHLAKQTPLGVGLVDLLALASGQGQARIEEAFAAGDRAVLFDVVDEASLVEVGRLVWENRAAAPFSASSSGLEYALTSYWRSAGLLPEAQDPPRASEVDRIAVASGSCSPETATTIRYALEKGYVGIRLDPRSVARGETGDALSRASAAASEGRSFILYTALGPDDEAVVEASETLRNAIGRQLGRLLGRALEQTKIRRAVVCGGDTSAGVGQELDIYAVTAVAPMAPGSPLCRAWSNGPLDGLELVFKGGQVGGPNFLEEARRGAPSSSGLVAPATKPAPPRGADPLATG